MIGKSILNYEITSLIGEGGMGSVFLGKHTQVERTVAIKSLLPQFMSNNEVKQRFKNEASTLARLQHPNIVGLFDYYEDESGMFLIMEYVKGNPLDEFIRDVTGPMPEERAVPIMKGILEGFSYAHQQGIIHRDIKPANVIITKEDEVKILDFGIARLLGDGNHNLTKTGTQMGTVYYMSPEQVQGKKVDVRSDIYSLGVTFYQMLTGVNPYNGLTTEYEVYSKIVKEDLPPPQEIYPGIPLYLSSVLKKALAKDPDDRFQNCEEFLNAINSKLKVETKSDSNQVENNINNRNQITPIKNNSASVGLILGIIGMVFSFIPFASFLGFLLCIIAIIFGLKGLSNIRKNEELNYSKGKSKAGLILGIIGLVISLIMSLGLIYFLYFKDSDGDGLIDFKDMCPHEMGDYMNSGCPKIDSDSDGVYDDYDQCVNESGPIENNGCPLPTTDTYTDTYTDSDGDGIYDGNDQCMYDSGPIENNGCPWSDTDGDGVFDDTDGCISEYGPYENNGCPEYDEEEYEGEYEGEYEEEEDPTYY
jgi:serine/threonine protein kinase